MPGCLRRIKALKTATDIHAGGLRAVPLLAAGWLFRYRGHFRVEAKPKGSKWRPASLPNGSFSKDGILGANTVSPI